MSSVVFAVAVAAVLMLGESARCSAVLCTRVWPGWGAAIEGVIQIIQGDFTLPSPPPKPAPPLVSKRTPTTMNLDWTAVVTRKLAEVCGGDRAGAAQVVCVPPGMGSVVLTSHVCVVVRCRQTVTGYIIQVREVAGPVLPSVDRTCMEIFCLAHVLYRHSLMGHSRLLAWCVVLCRVVLCIAVLCCALLCCAPHCLTVLC